MIRGSLSEIERLCLTPVPLKNWTFLLVNREEEPPFRTSRPQLAKVHDGTGRTVGGMYETSTKCLIIGEVRFFIWGMAGLRWSGISLAHQSEESGRKQVKTGLREKNTKVGSVSEIAFYYKQSMTAKNYLWKKRLPLLALATLFPFFAGAADLPKKPPGSSVIAMREAAHKGEAAAQYKFGLAYQLQGDEVNALLWFRKAARQGMAEAQYALGHLLVVNSGGGAKGRAIGIKWLSLAAGQNYLYAQRLLGDLYGSPRENEKNYVEAFKWQALAAKQDTTLNANVDALALRMTAEETSEALKKVEEFRPALPAKVVPEVKLQGLIGNGEKRLALINGKSFRKNEPGEIRVDDEMIKIQCLELTHNSALIKIEGEESPVTLILKNN